jgi:hypothetical protein
MIATPRSRSRVIVAKSSRTSASASAAVGSSITSTRASVDNAFDNNAFAISTSCCSPTRSDPTARFGSRSTPSSASWALAAAAIRRVSTVRRRVRGSRPRKMFSATDRPGTRSSSWWIIAMPAACASAGPRNRHGRPATVMLPSWSVITPARTFISVDLPAPFSPSSARTSPARTDSSASSQASTPPNRFVMPLMETSAPALSGTSPASVPPLHEIDYSRGVNVGNITPGVQALSGYGGDPHPGSGAAPMGPEPRSRHG